MLTEEIITHFKGVIGKNGRYMAKCPCNCSRKRTLHVKAVDVITLIYCESGCKAIDVTNALKITLDDLKDDRNMSWQTEIEVCR